MIKASELIGLPVYTVSGKEIGRAFDLIINLPEGRVERITLQPIAASSRDDARRIFREKTVLYSSVTAVREIIIVSSEAAEQPEPESRPEPHVHAYRHRFGYRK